MLNMSLGSARHLRQALMGNAVFSTFCGASILLADPLIAAFLGTPDVSLVPLGVALLIFAAYLLLLSRSNRLPKAVIGGVIGGDWAWVAASVALVVIKSEWFAPLGMGLILAVAIAVMMFALWQGRGLKELELATA